MATHSSILACKIPWTEEPGGLQSMGWQKSQMQLSTHPCMLGNFTGKINYNNILPTAVLCSVLSFSTCTISLIGKGLLFKHVIKQMDIPQSPEDNSSRIGKSLITFGSVCGMIIQNAQFIFLIAL